MRSLQPLRSVKTALPRMSPILPAELRSLWDSHRSLGRFSDEEVFRAGYVARLVEAHLVLKLDARPKRQAVEVAPY
jgi:hypothetical protein